jgi:anti-sigma factor RsiW
MWSDTLAAYLLDALPDEERAGFERHLGECRSCRDEAASLQPAVDVLAIAVPPVEAPRELKGRVMQVVKGEAELLRAAGSDADAPAPSRRRGLRGWFPRPAITAAATAGALAIGVLAGVAIVGGDDDGASTRTIQARVTGPAAGGARAVVVVDGDRARLDVSGMPAPEPGRVWQVWVKPPGRPPVPAGATFELRSGQVAIPRRVSRGDQVMVSSEPDGGSTFPTRDPVVVAQPA